MRTVAITTLGCKINQFESAAMAEKLAAGRFRIVPFSEKADFYIINTCTVTARTDAESRQLIRRAARQNPQAKIVVTGCYAQVAKDELKDMPGVSLVLGNGEKKGIDLLLEAAGSERQVIVSAIGDETAADRLLLQSFAEHTRAFLQIQNGCNEFCTYCIVPHARGRSRSVPLADVVAGIATFAAKDYREIVLIGIHLGAYGLDLQPPRSLLDILAVVENERPVERLRLGSVEPQEITDPFIGLLGASTIICPHLHIPLQSGSDTVLERMGRRYTGRFFAERIEKLVAASPGIAIGADVIAGFPGETDDDFEETRSLIDSLPLAYLHVFPYSPRKGTPAATMTGQVAAGTVKARAKTLRDLSERKKGEFLARFVGRELSVLFLNKGKNGRIKGLSRNYIQVSVEGKGAELLNEERSVLVTEITGGEARGDLVTSPPAAPP